MKPSLCRQAVILSVTLPLLAFSCTKTQEDEDIPGEPVQIELTAKQSELVKSENTFSFDIFKEVLKASAESENILISPLSISFALSMATNGANGPTLDAMLEAMRVKDLTMDDLNISYKKLTEALLSIDKRVDINIANSVWTENKFNVKAPFTGILKNYYNAEAESFDINDPSAPQKMNQWIENKTNGLIKNMIDKLSDNAVMLLINAIYFKGKWKHQFDEQSTVQLPFYKSGSSVFNVPMMRQTEEMKFFDGDGFKIAELPYGQGNFVMDIILPDQNDGLKDIEAIMGENSFADFISLMETRKVNLYLPRFKYSYKKELKDILTLMGMGLAFTDNADFSNISDLDLLLNKVTHQAFIETNEEGTEAAAATVVEVGVTSINPDQPVIFKADHPFLYVIREIETNSIIFMGRVNDPLAE
jgi:serpin B